jgi:hypothetical protein
MFQFDRVDRMMDILAGVAAAHGVINYGSIAKRVGTRANFLANPLGQVSRRAVSRGEPMWSALVVSRMTGRPSEGFYRLARELRPEYANLSDDQLWQQELRRCYDPASASSEQSSEQPRDLATPLSPDSLYRSACGFARTALQHHAAGAHLRVVIDAVTALEHLAKACLAGRSPALLVEFRGSDGGNFASLLRLLRLPAAGPVRPLRTVGVQGALERVKVIVPPKASWTDLQELMEIRNGTVHAAEDADVEERLVAAFVQHADTLLTDLGRSRAEFWDRQTEMADALLAAVGDKAASRVELRIARARANFDANYGHLAPEAVEVVRRLAAPQAIANEQVPCLCPACGSLGAARGVPEFTWRFEDPVEGEHFYKGEVTEWFAPAAFTCQVCGVHLDSPAELSAAGMSLRMNDKTMTFDVDAEEEAAAEAAFYEGRWDTEPEEEERTEAED